MAFANQLRKWVLLTPQGETRVFRCDIGRAFRREEQAEADKAPLTTMQILNHEGFIGPWPLEEPAPLSPWATVRYWYGTLKSDKDQWDSFIAACSRKLQSGGEIKCSFDRTEINFKWAGMFGAMMLWPDNKNWSSHT